MFKVTFSLSNHGKSQVFNHHLGNICWYFLSSFRKVYPYINNPDAPWDWNILRTWIGWLKIMDVGTYSKQGACEDIDSTLPETNIAPEN